MHVLRDQCLPRSYSEGVQPLALDGNMVLVGQRVYSTVCICHSVGVNMTLCKIHALAVLVSDTNNRSIESRP